MSVLTPLLRGGSTVIAGKFDRLTFFDLVEKVRPSYFSGVPTIYALLAALPPSYRPDTSSLRFGLCGAAPAPAGLLDGFERRFGFPVVEGYGLSEATCATTINPIHGRRKPGTVGLPMPGQQVRIVGADRSPVADGAVGEVTINGANVMRGYLGREDETERVLVEGWLFTGDLGHLDEDGYLVLDGRSKDMIIRGGENIYPREIEDVIAADPRVGNVAVVGAPHLTWGEIVVAYVTLPRGGDQGRALAELALLCEARLGSYKRPASIKVLDEMPINAMGKIDKVRLRARAAAPA